MERVTEHEELASLLGAYALDAVEPEEAELVERHLAVCPRCREEVAQHREVTGLLGFMGQEAPAGVWDRITASMQEAPPALRLERVGSAKPGLAPVVNAGATASRRRRMLAARPVAALAAAAAIVVAILGVQVARLDHRTGVLKSQVTALAGAPAPTSAVVHEALAQPHARQVALKAPGGSTPALDAVILPNGTGYIYNSHLTPLPTDRTYQLWGVGPAETISYGVLGSNPSVVAFHAPSDVQQLAVTSEVASGAVHPADPPVAVGRLA